MLSSNHTIHIVGAGLAGSECAYQLAQKGHRVCLYEVRASKNKTPSVTTPAHSTNYCSELVCSNSFGSSTDYSAPGQLKWEAEKLDSLILRSAHEHSVPAGMALSVDRQKFAEHITKTLNNHPLIEIQEKEITSLEDVPRPAIIATGPLTLGPLANSLRDHFDSNFLYFFDAIAPIIDADSINYDVAWFGDRFDKGTKDYLNCPLNQEQYEKLISEIKLARKVEAKSFEKVNYEDTPFFDACMPIEEIIRRGDESLRFGALSPKGLQKQGPELKKHAVVQLRKENKEGSAYNMVGFQTKMAYPEQKRIFRMIPGLEEAEFLKLGSIHRNLYIHSPSQLTPFLSSKKDPELFFAGQITGVEGYFESSCIGLLVSRFLHEQLTGNTINKPPRESAMGSLLHAITDPTKENFQPTNINFSLMPTPEGSQFKGRRNKQAKKDHVVKTAQNALSKWLLDK